MKLSYRWLCELVDLEGITPAEVAHRLTFHTAEVEDVEELGAAWDGVIAARVTAVAPHPDAEKLRLCRVDTGDGASPEVVCGAPNVAVGQAICFAPTGTTLPSNGGPLRLEAREIRGVLSQGMICAEDELGLGPDHEGILVLETTAAPGTPIADVLGLRDTILDVGNTAITQRPDLWGHVGFARELSAIFERELHLPGTDAAATLLAEASADPFPVTIEDEDGCRRYVGLAIEGLSNRASPQPMRRRLESLGMRSIDLLVDLTNWVLLEQGQPLHAFDVRDLEGGEIRVRRGAPGERMKTLDGLERVVGPDDVLIADAKRPVAVAGVMGGEDSEVRADTTEILLESATFDAVRIRRTAARLGLRTEASARFEKSLDPELALTGALRFAELVHAHIPEARFRRALADRYPRPYPPVTLDLPYALVRRRLGVRLADERVRSRLRRLGFDVEERRARLAIRVPSWRATKDVECAEDLVEEVGRIGGYDVIPAVAPVAPITPTLPPPARHLERRVASILSLDRGYSEVTNYLFYSVADAERLGVSDLPHLRIENPLSEEHDRLGLTAAAGLLRNVARNQAHAARGRLWESTRLIPPGNGNGLPREVPTAALVAWDREAEDDGGALFLGLVGDVRALLERLGIAEHAIEDGGAGPLDPALPNPGWLHPGRNAALTWNGHVLAVAGEVAPGLVRACDLQGRVALAEVHLERLREAAEAGGDRYVPILRYPVVPFDVSVFVPRRTPAAEVERVIAAAAAGSIRNIGLFDVYEGEGIPEGQRSLAFTCELFDRGRTLDAQSADALRRKVIAGLEAAGFTVRTA